MTLLDFKFQPYITDVSDQLDLFYIPYATKLEKLHREIPHDPVLLRIENLSTIQSKQSITSIIFSKEEFINEFFPRIEAFKDYLLTAKGNPTMRTIYAASGKTASIEFDPTGKINIHIKYGDSVRTSILNKRGLTVEETNHLLKEYKFTDEIAGLNNAKNIK